MGQEKYLLGAQLRWMVWRPYRPGWDHDQCAFCQSEISDRPVDEHTLYNAAWVTASDEYTWICPSCFDDFRERFRWEIVPTP